ALRGELPVISRTIRNEWVPYVQGRLRAVGLGARPALSEPEGDDPEPSPTFVASPRGDGSVGFELEGPISVSPAKGGGYTIEPLREAKAEPFDLDQMVADLAGKSLSYAQQNALEVV